MVHVGKVRAVLFDMYGTLGEPDEQIVPSFLGYIEGLGFSTDEAIAIERVVTSNVFDGIAHGEESHSKEAYERWLYGTVFAEVRKYNNDPDISLLVDTLMSYYIGIETAMCVYPEALGVLRSLRAKGVRVVVASNWAWTISHAIEAMGLDRMVDAVHCSARLGARKPNPLFFERILIKELLHAGDVLFVGDTWSTDIVGALGVGITPVYIDRSGNSQRSQVGVQVLSNLEGVLGLL